MIRSGRRTRTRKAGPIAAALALLLTVAATPTDCPGGDPRCNAEPAGEIIAFVVREEAPVTFRGKILDVEPANSSGIVHYVVEEPGGERHRFAFRAPPAITFPLTAGMEYEFRFEYVMGEPSPSSMVVLDDAGLLFATVSDFAPGDRVLAGGIPGLDVSLESAGCNARAVPPCFESIENLALRVSMGGPPVALMQGESATLDGFEITVLAARELEYSDRCADAGKLGVIYAVARTSR